jgi:hypothetical protein
MVSRQFKKGGYVLYIASFLSRDKFLRIAVIFYIKNEKPFLRGLLRCSSSWKTDRKSEIEAISLAKRPPAKKLLTRDIKTSDNWKLDYNGQMEDNFGEI